jgi:hypothetical protein
MNHRLERSRENREGMLIPAVSYPGSGTIKHIGAAVIGDEPSLRDRPSSGTTSVDDQYVSTRRRRWCLVDDADPRRTTCNARPNRSDQRGMGHSGYVTDRYERCPGCGAAGSIHVLDGSEHEEGICAVCFVHVRRSLIDRRWKVRTYGG